MSLYLLSKVTIFTLQIHYMQYSWEFAVSARNYVFKKENNNKALICCWYFEIVCRFREELWDSLGLPFFFFFFWIFLFFLEWTFENACRFREKLRDSLGRPATEQFVAHCKFQKAKENWKTCRALQIQCPRIFTGRKSVFSKKSVS